MKPNRIPRWMLAVSVLATLSVVACSGVGAGLDPTVTPVPAPTVDAAATEAATTSLVFSWLTKHNEEEILHLLETADFPNATMMFENLRVTSRDSNSPLPGSDDPSYVDFRFDASSIDESQTQSVSGINVTTGGEWEVVLRFYV